MWMAHTIELPLREHYSVMRLFGRLQDGAKGDTRWDLPVAVTKAMLDDLAPMVGKLLTNAPVKPSAFPLPPPEQLFAESSYDAIAIVDASATGFGAIVRFVASGETVEIRSGWEEHIAHSAWAEPRGATEIVRLLRSRGMRRIAVVSDHVALAQGQRKPLSGNNGFSRSFWLNEFYRALYDGGDGEVFFVEGQLNLADTPSRNTMLGDRRWHVAPYSGMFPSLHNFFHPPSATSTTPRAWWHA
jgi:hypothetical protein